MWLTDGQMAACVVDRLAGGELCGGQMARCVVDSWEGGGLCGRQVGRWHLVRWTGVGMAAWLEEWKVTLLSLGQGNLMKKYVITIYDFVYF